MQIDIASANSSPSDVASYDVQYYNINDFYIAHNKQETNKTGSISHGANLIVPKIGYRNFFWTRRGNIPQFEGNSSSFQVTVPWYYLSPSKLNHVYTYVPKLSKIDGSLNIMK